MCSMGWMASSPVLPTLFSRYLSSANFSRVGSSTGPAASRVRLRLADGTLVAPAVKSLADADVERDGPFCLVTIEAPPDESVRIWACAATRDGFVSPPGGPWRAGAGAP